MSKLDELKALMAAAMPGELRVERVHDLWVELRTGYGLQNRMVADCLSERDAKLHEAAVNSLPALIAAVEALKELIDAGDNCVNPKDDDDVAAMLRFGKAHDLSRAALAPFGE